jgi:HK97 family phage portal protein
LRFLGLDISRQKNVPVLAQSMAPTDRGWWSLTKEPFAGAWQRNIQVSRETVLAHSAVYACITLIAADIAKLRPKLVEQDKDGIWTETTSAAFSPVLRKPNDYQNRIKFIEQWIISKLIHGNTYVLKQRDNRGLVTALYVLDPTRVKPLVAPDGAVYYKLGVDHLSGLTEPVDGAPASEIIHDLMVPLYHPLVGVSPIYACGLAAAQGLNIQNNSTKFFANSSRPSGMLTAPGKISDVTAARLKETWEQNYSGENVGRVSVLGDGLKYETMTMKATDAQLIEQLRWTGENVCSCYHVPPYMIGVGPAPTYNNIEALNQQYYTQCLQSLIEALELCLDEGLGLVDTPGRSYGVEMDLDGLLRMDTATQYKAIADGIRGGFLKPNEGRAKIDLKPVAGGDTCYMQHQDYSLAALRSAMRWPIHLALPRQLAATRSRRCRPRRPRRPRLLLLSPCRHRAGRGYFITL